ncbi:MAG: hypothetical protein KIT84_25030 [Labilithrix sp.]|nr:hypothetical protein [Labilithrix sp.]MCW5814315.1 hypothetical protein [Labilithrix sp.]
MSAPNEGEIAALKKQAEGLQRSLSAVQERLEVLSRQEPTVQIPRPGARASFLPLLAVGAGSSVATALVVGVLFMQSRRSEIPDPPPPLEYYPAEPPPCQPAAVTPPPAPLPPVHVVPSSGTGALTVVCLPIKCDQVIDNGQALGPGHVFNRPVSAGRHHLVLSAPNGVRKSIIVEVLPDRLKDVRVAMDESPKLL